MGIHLLYGNDPHIYNIIWLVASNIFYFSIYWEESSQLTNSIIFQRDRSTTNQIEFSYIYKIIFNIFTRWWTIFAHHWRSSWGDRGDVHRLFRGSMYSTVTSQWTSDFLQTIQDFKNLNFLQIRLAMIMFFVGTTGSIWHIFKDSLEMTQTVDGNDGQNDSP